jgi:hypothetical protein
MQMVKDRPFALSEWIHVQPNEWNAEGPAIVGVYGMGLQGLGRFVSLCHQRNWLQRNCKWPAPVEREFTDANRTLSGSGAYDLSWRCQRRQSHFHAQSQFARVAKGEIGFEERVAQSGDVKMFNGDVPVEALAAGKVEVQFTRKPEKTAPLDMSTQLRKKVIVSNTGQLMWDYSQEKAGYFTVDTPGTKAVVGFAPKKPLC